MNYWLFTVTQKKINGEVFAPDDILKQRLTDKFWGLGERTPNRRNLKKGDKVVFYVSVPIAAFAASATLASDSFSLSDVQKSEFSHGNHLYLSDYGVMLEDIRLWGTPRQVKFLLPSLIFVENKENWGAYFQGGARQLREDDYQTIVSTRQPIVDDYQHIFDASLSEESIISKTQFALEAHLEEFIAKNWKHIHFGTNIDLYEADEQSGRQFPAGTWNIDFLCIDKSTSDFVVIELKRGKTSDATVGQILRYISWVKENLAKEGQRTKGIIIAQEVDDALRYAVREIENVRVLTYQVDFKLLPFSE